MAGSTPEHHVTIQCSVSHHKKISPCVMKKMRISAAVLFAFLLPTLVQGQPNYCSASQVVSEVSDTCIFRLDGKCNNNLKSVCDVGTDCFDCDPCLAFAKDCATCTKQDYCGWCTTGTGVGACLSLGFVETFPSLCSDDGGTEWKVGTCSAAVPTVPPSPTVSIAPPSPSLPIPTQPYSCNYAKDSCSFTFDGACDAGIYCPRNTDCFDCDPCQELRLEGCDVCTAAGCVWCASDAICLSSSDNIALATSFSCQAKDFVSTCPAPSTSVDGFDDPLKRSQSWVFEQINLQEAWDLGYSGKGVGIRVNDDGVDNRHPEFEGRFVTESSCTIYRPVSLEGDHGHGTAVASVALGSGNDGSCGVGVAPGARLSACRIIRTNAGETITPEAEDNAVLYVKMDGMDISQNSYGTTSCRSLTDESRRNLQTTVCPFSSSTVCATCRVDWSKPVPSALCERVITEYCTDPFQYQNDHVACSSFLDLFVKCEYSGLDPATSLALEKGITQGRKGKGIIYVFASGNDYSNGADTNFEGTLTSRYTISVGAIGRDGLQATYSTGGAALFLSAPGGDRDNYANLFAASPGGGCQSISAGTSFSSPLVSGVIALMLEANPDLTWRDVQGILATTSRRVDSNDPSWVANGAGNHHSYLYGFGVVNAGAAVKAAKSWELFSAELQIVAESSTINLPIPDFPAEPVTSAVTVTNRDFIMESASVYLDLRHASRGDLDIMLVSPSGTESLLHPGSRPENSQIEGKWKLMTLRSWGESAQGVWTLRLVDRKAGYVSNCVDFVGWTFDYFGTALSCNSLERLEACTNGRKGAKLFFYFGSGSLSDSILADENGITPDKACCACGGGVPASGVQNVLRSWQLVLYGRSKAGGTFPAPSTPGTLKPSKPSGSPISSTTSLSRAPVTNVPVIASVTSAPVVAPVPTGPAVAPVTSTPVMAPITLAPVATPVASPSPQSMTPTHPVSPSSKAPSPFRSPVSESKMPTIHPMKPVPPTKAPIVATKPVPANCASLDTCFLENIKTGNTTALFNITVEQPNVYSVGKGDRYTVFCEVRTGGTTNSMEFHYNNMTHTEWKKPWYMGGNGDSGWIGKVDYLTTDCGSVKTLEVVGKVWKGECFRSAFNLTLVC